MKILAISDTHGKLDKVRDIWPKLTDIDMIIHAGDFIRDGKALSKELKVPVVTVKGNCDNGYSHDDFETVATEYGDILVTHGHMENVKYRLDNLLYKALENDCRAAVSYTHLDVYKRQRQDRPCIRRSDESADHMQRSSNGLQQRPSGR